MGPSASSEGTVVTADPLASVFSAWTRGKSALLYGPPGTGKTRILSELLQKLKEPDVPVGDIGLDLSDPADPFKALASSSNVHGGGLPLPIKTVWLTFHQSLGYEDFVIGLHPETVEGRVSLVPRAGALLEAVIDVQQGDVGSVVILIDEINRGNAAKIFGEFLTFLDFDYRETDTDGNENVAKLPLPVRHLGHSNGKYDPIKRQDGSLAKLSYPSYFPRHVYVVATMNSVDRTAIPIDSALARRFDRIDIRPDLVYLADVWTVELDGLADRAKAPEDLSPAETALLILDRLNLSISENFGPDFELGHGLISHLQPYSDEAWAQLAWTWDRVIFPQIEDRFAGRTESLAVALRVDEFDNLPYAWRYRRSLVGDVSTSVLAPVTLAEIDIDLARSSLQRLASRPAAQ